MQRIRSAARVWLQEDRTLQPRRVCFSAVVVSFGMCITRVFRSEKVSIDRHTPAFVFRKVQLIMAFGMFLSALRTKDSTSAQGDGNRNTYNINQYTRGLSLDLNMCTAFEQAQGGALGAGGGRVGFAGGGLF